MEAALTALGWLAWLATLYLAVSLNHGIFVSVKERQSVTRGTVASAWLSLALLAVPFFSEIRPVWLLAAAPAVLLATVYFLPWPIGAIASVLAAIAQLAGMLVERWLFFAEAKHTVTLYYGR